MKSSVQKSKAGAGNLQPGDASVLRRKMIAAENKVKKAHAEFENKSAAYEDGVKQQLDKIVLLGLQASAKIARLTYKIRRIEYKLARSAWKKAAKTGSAQAEKTLRKSVERPIDKTDKKKGKKAPHSNDAKAKAAKKKGVTVA